ncbi:extracellular adherence protein Eap/Map [Staphylococcus aureus]|uniref:extracellular adherence protein Eap/Map n=1 Tax=Staphylococcus aureus TaxID=1280 RepID=UPI000DA8CFAB|nr:extracellular adherence protein Eap/Map [Staphylococcus aureus]MDI0241411.1 extracellular adherence protein Eap/Map [Staphylococcus aureus]PZH48868.1 protein map [Staphylococcus aureus]PZH66856.1 protein map [Staphylococcus aureus]PZI24636.1 protein map [Staphylococcus aureus]HDE8850066.1 extracellular adherence protein Eap/Map [Staphylococcus aureus]
MKFKSLITTTLALGVIASTGANFNTNEASAAAKQLDKSSSSLHHGHSKIQVPYTITVNGTSQNILSSLTFNKNQQISYKDIENKVKSVLYFNRGISDIDLRLSKQAKYTVVFKNGTKKVIDLKAGIYTANLINSSDIKNININVDTKKQAKDKAKTSTQVPYSINLNGTSTNILSNLSFSNKPWTNYKNLTDKVKSVLKSNRGVSERDLKHAKKAYYTVYFKNGGKRVIHLNSNVYTANLVHAKDIKKIEVTVKTGSKAKAERYVPYTIAVNGTSTPNLSDLKFTGDSRVSYSDITKKVKSVLKHDRGIGERELRYAKKATYTVHFKNGTKKVINLNSKISQLNLLFVKDIKKIDIDVKTGSKAKADSYVPYTIAVNGTSTPILSKLKLSNKQLIGYQDLNEKVKSVLKHDRGINDIELKFAKQAKYTIHFKNGKTQVVDLKSDIFTRNLFSVKDIKKIDINVKQHTKANKEVKKATNNKVNFPVTINGFSNIVSNEFVFYNASKITINDLSTKLKSAMANDQGITKHDIGLAERAVYKVYFKDGTSKYVDLKTEYKDAKVFKASDVKKVDIEIKF